MEPNPLDLLRACIRESTLLVNTEPAVEHSVSSRLLFLAEGGDDLWGEKSRPVLEFLAKKIEINVRIFSAYNEQGKAIGRERLTGVSYDLLVQILGYAALSIPADAAPNCVLRTYNALFKAAVHAPGDWTQDDHPIWSAVLDGWRRVAPELSAVEHTPAVSACEHEARTLPLTVLFYESPIARAYLQVLDSLGCRPERIIHIVSVTDIATRKPVGAWLPKSMRVSYAAANQRRRIHHWPRVLRSKYAKNVATTLRTVAQCFNFELSVIETAHELGSLSDFADIVEPMLVTGLKDEGLRERLAKESNPILFTGGGIVPAKLLTAEMPPFVHIHPGFLPDIRGADGLLWSYLLYGRASASSFYMAPGIDTGCITSRHWLPTCTLEFPLDGLDVTTLYRFAYAYIDPWVRGYVLRDLLARNNSYDQLACTKQFEEEGNTYHFMHDELRRLALSKIFIAEAR